MNKEEIRAIILTNVLRLLDYKTMALLAYDIYDRLPDDAKKVFNQLKSKVE